METSNSTRATVGNPKCDNAKNKLQEFCQFMGLPFPVYHSCCSCMRTDKVREDVLWICTVQIRKEGKPGNIIVEATAWGSTKKAASMNAATAMLYKIRSKTLTLI